VYFGDVPKAFTDYIRPIIKPSSTLSFSIKSATFLAASSLTVLTVSEQNFKRIGTTY